MCEQCTAATKTYGEVVPHWSLIQATRDGNYMKENDFGLVNCNDPSFIWSGDVVPLKDPTFEFTDEQFDATMSAEDDALFDKFIANAEILEASFKSDPESGYSLIINCMKAGYDRKKHNRFMLWLLHRIAIVMERNPTADDALVEKFALEDFGQESIYAKQ